MIRFEKFVKHLFLTFLTVFLVLAGTLTWVLTNPKQAFHIAERYFLPEDLKITWDGWNFKITRVEGFTFHIDWQMNNLLIVKAQPHMHLPIRKIQLDAAVAPFKKSLAIQELIVISETEMEFEPSGEKSDQPEKNIFQQIQGTINLFSKVHDHVTYENVQIGVKKFSLLNKKSEPLEFAGKMTSTKGSSKLEYRISIGRDGASPLAIKADGFLDPQLMQSQNHFLESEVRFSGFKTEVTQNISAVYFEDAATLILQGAIEYSAGQFKLISQPKIKMVVDSKRAELEITSDVQGIPGLVTKVNDLKFKSTTPLDESVMWSEKPTEYSLLVPIELNFFNQSVKDQLQKNCNCKLPLALIAKSNGKIWLAQLFNDEAQKHTFLDADLTVDNVKNSLFDINLAASIKIEKNKAEWTFLPVLNCDVLVSDFKGIAPILDVYKVLIPAPLDVLNGSLHLQAQGPVTQDVTGSQFPAKLDVNLSSKRQLVRLKNDATITLSPDYKKMNVQTKASIDDLQIELPPLDPVGGKPRITVDKRILKAPPIKVKDSKFQISFNIEVETSHAAAIRLLSEYFKPYLPLTLKIGINSQKGNSGFLQTEPFDIVYLRRKVRVERLFLDLSQIDNDVIPVDGRFKIQQTHYTVFIDVKGNAKSPNVTMSSEPELSQSDIISVLLYDRVNSELASADAETTGGVQAAIADRAIGLFGLWAFASTPIRSFSYNPVTKVYTATVALGGDVTAGIGTTWESTAQLELRKRVSKQWMLTASWTAATSEKDQNTEVVLQWEKRF